ncbi:MAG: M24 family metallopeptidase [Steroidobacteraceae bacterium]
MSSDDGNAVRFPMNRRGFLKSTTSSAVLATVSAASIRDTFGAGTHLSGAGGAANPEMFFTRDEYQARWSRVQAAMAAAGFDNLLVWQRSAGTYDKVGDVYWLTNFYTDGTGQDPLSEELDEPWTFAAVLIRKGREPELHIGLVSETYDASKIFCGKVVTHTPHMTLKLAEYLRAEHIEGRVAVVGDDVLPGYFDRILRKNTPQISWVTQEGFLEGPQMIKSARELEAYRAAGSLVSSALDAAMQAMIAGERACDAAARAASVLISGGGGFHRISIAHGPTMASPLSFDFYGYDMKAPAAGDFVCVWIYGPVFAGYWLDPGRTSICARRPTPQQREVVENCANIVSEMVKAIKPGITGRDVGLRWEEMARKNRYFDEKSGDELFGHGLGTGFPSYTLPMGDPPAGPFGYRKLQGPLKPGMVLTAEAFVRRPGIGSAGFENNFIVTQSGTELLDKTPMLYW